MQSSWIHDLTDLFLAKEASTALVTSDGDILFAKSNLEFECTSFQSIVEYSLKHIALRPGDILITNDPYIGGTFLHRYTFLIPLTAPSPNSNSLILCVRRENSPRLCPAKKIDDEGLRIPPTPILQNGNIITPIIDAIAAHPLCPEGFKNWIDLSIRDLQEHFKKWKSLEKNLSVHFSNQQIKKALSDSRKFAIEKIAEKTQGEGRSEVLLDTGEVLKLRLEVRDGQAKADFGGTSPGLQTFISDSTTLGACYDVISEFYGLNLLKNSGTFSILQVVKPSGCFLNAKFPQPTNRGLQSGVSAVKLAMNMALRQIVKNQECLKTESDVRIEMVFSKDRRWFSQWSAESVCESFSLQKTETNYPIKFLKLEKSNEKSHLHIEFKTLEPCQIRWNSDFSVHPLKPPTPWKATASSLLEVLDQNQEWTKLPSYGISDLTPGVQVRVRMWGHFESNAKP